MTLYSTSKAKVYNVAYTPSYTPTCYLHEMCSLLSYIPSVRYRTFIRHEPKQFESQREMDRIGIYIEGVVLSWTSSVHTIFANGSSAHSGGLDDITN